MFDFTPFIKIALKEANTRLKGQYNSVIEATRYIAEHNDLDRPMVERLIEKAHQRRLNIIGYDMKRYAHPFLFINASKYGANDVYEASKLYQDIQQKPSHYLLKASTWKYMADMLLGETIRRYKK